MSHSPLPVHDTEAAVAFVREVLGNRATLTAIGQDTGAIETRAFPDLFDMARIKAMTDWIEQYQGKRNLYWTINSTLKPMNKKPAETDIKSMDYLHVDCDPRAVNDPPEEARPRILATLGKYPKPPTVIIDSGNGFQALWKLNSPQPIDGDQAKADDAKLYSKKLAGDLEGDNCHNTDRLFRLPGTINLPNKKKRDRGRVPTRARLELHEPSRVYKIEDFRKAASTAAPNTGTAIAKRPQVEPANIAAGTYAVAPAPNWEERLSNLGQMIRAHGDNLTTLWEHLEGSGMGKRYASNSEMGHAYTVTLVNAGYTDAEVHGDLMDRENPAGKHYRSQKNYTRAINRSIDKARVLQTGDKLDAAFGIAFPDSYDKDGIPHVTYGNTRAAIDGLGIECQLDVYRDKIYVAHHEVGAFTGEITDKIYTLVQDAIYNSYGFYPKSEYVEKSIMVRACESSFDPVLDWINGLKWQGASLLDDWLIKYMGAKDTAYVRAVGRKVLIGAIRRVRQPGCKLDSTLVLESRQQGIGKSLFCADLAGAPDLFTDQELLALDNKGQQELLQGKWIAEIAELAGLRKADLQKVKAFLTRTTDRARPAYGRVVVERPRRGIQIATTNEREYLRDETGNRRLWPVKILRYDRQEFQRDREQLLAEAAHYEATEESLYLPDEVAADVRAEQQSRMMQDGWEDLLANETGTLINGQNRVASSYLLETILKLPADKHSDSAMKRLAVNMNKLGWEGPAVMKLDHGRKAKAVRGYSRPADPEQQELPR
jgi:hypothetical protein